MASDDKLTEPTVIPEDNEATDGTSSCLNDPNYAIICVFLQKFGSHLKIEHPDFLRLQKMIENTDEVHEELKQFFVRLLRKTRKSVQPDKLDTALAKFCYTYSVQDAWEIERFGYKRSGLAVKLRILKEVLESQFDKNPNFRTIVSAQSATELRSQPLGKDKLGNAYWSTVDDQCNLRIYQEHLDEEIWKVVATNRDEMAKLIACLRGNELVMPSMVGIIDEDSSSNSMPPKVDALGNEAGASNGSSNGTVNGHEKEAIANLKIKLNTENGSESTVEQIKSSDNTNGSAKKSTSTGLDDEDDGNTSVMSEIDEFSQAASESSATTIGTKSNETQGSKRITLLSSKPPSHNKLRLRISNKRNLEMDSDTTENGNKRISMMGSRKSRYQESEEDFESDSSDEELGSEEMSNEDDECGSAIEEPMMLVQGEGSGHANKCENVRFPEDSVGEAEDNGIGEAIEEEVFFVFGEGSGHECDVGNNDVKATESTTTSSAEVTPAVTPSKPMFFFGQAGCLKLSPMRTAVSTPPLNEKKNDSETDKNNEETSNDSNLIASEANSLSNDAEENAATRDETDKATVSNINQESSLSASCESETKNEPTEMEPECSQPNKVDSDLSDVSNESIKNNEVVSEPNDIVESETNKEIIDANKLSEENKIEVNRSDESTSCINNSHVNVESNDAVALKSDQVQDNEQELAQNVVECGMNSETPSNSEIGENNESELNQGESEIAEPIVQNESTKSIEQVECNDQISSGESEIEASSVVEDNVPIDEAQTNVPNAEIKNETERKEEEELERSPETQEDEQLLNETSAQESPIAESENVVESINEPVQELSEHISEKFESIPVESSPQQSVADQNVGGDDSNEEQNSQVDDSQQKEDIQDPILEGEPSHNETNPRDDNDQSPVPSESVTREIGGTLQTEDAPKESDSIDLKAIESFIIPNSGPKKEAVGAPSKIWDQVSNEPTTSAQTFSQKINEKHQTPAEVTTAECPGSIKEKRKSIDQIEEPVICKRVYICGEKDLDEVKPEASIQNKTLTKPNEIPQTVLPVSETLPTIESVSLEKPLVQNKLAEAVVEIDKNKVITENWIQSKIPEQSVSSDDVNELYEQKSGEISPVIQSIPEIAEGNVEPIAVQTENKSKTVLKSALPSPKAAQSRTRKRRISGDKPRHSSESEIESPLSQDQSSDEEVGGKRIKMRAKVVQKSVRKSIEHKRNVKNADWSSDENEKPNAKRATSDVLNQTETSVPDVKKECQPVSVKPIKQDPVKEDPIKEDPIKDEILKEEPVKEEPEQHSDEEQAAVPQRRSGRPARKAKKPPPPRATRSKVVEETNQTIKEEKEEDVKQEETLEEIPPTPAPVQLKPEGRRKKRSLMGLDIDEIQSVQAAADETPVRQSRRIAQLKIREEAERRKAEEVALHKMKEASEKKKKGSTKAPPSESEEENSESEAKLEKKKKKKKGNKDRPWQTDSDAVSSEREEDDYEHEDHERLPPLGSDHEFSPESDIEDESQIVPTKRARTARKDKAEKKTEEESEEEDVHACQKCSKNDHPEWILLCDKCDKGYHCSCLIPVLFVIPEGEWFCPTCQQEKLIDALEARLADYDALIKQKEVEEAQRQRLLLNTVNETNILRDTKRDRQRARAQISGSSDDSSESSEASEIENENESRDRRAKTRQKNRQRKRSDSDESEVSKSSSDDTSDNEPIYKLRKRRQANVSYRFNEYDELINRAIKSEMDEVAGAGNLGRGKDISTIMEADKEEKRLKKLEQQQKNDNDSDEQRPLAKSGKVIASEGSDSEPIRPRIVNRSKNSGRKKKKLNSLDDDSDEADSDDDFNETSSDNSSDSDGSESEESDSSMDSLVRKRKNKSGRMSTRRSNRERKKRFDADFIDDDSFDEEDNKPLVKKKKKKIDSDFSDFNESSDSSKIDSEDLCDDSTDESDKPWSKSKKSKSKPAPKSNNKGGKTETDEDRPFKGKTSKKKSRISDDEDDDDDDESDEDSQEVLPKSRRTRGKKLPYLVDDDFDSSDDGIKPGVKRPDTPPEERAAFIKKQEEIKRMLAEKGEVSEKLLKNPPPSKASLSTIPLQVIQTAKALDVDLKKSAITHRNGSDNDSNGFDDDLPEDFDPEDMDEDAIAKMMEEEDFAQQQLKLASESMRIRKNNKDTEIPKKLEVPAKLSVDTAVMAPVVVSPALVSPLPFSSTLTIPDIPQSMYTSQIQTINTKITATPKKRGRKTKDDISPILDAAKAARGIPEQFLSKEPSINPSLSAIQHTSTIPPSKSSPLGLPPPLQHTPPSQMFPHVSSAIQHTSSVIAHSSVIQQRPLPSIITPSSALGISLHQQAIIPSTILDVQNTRLLDPSELGKPPDNILESPTKKRGRRKKVTPLRESISSPPNTAVSPPGVSSPISVPNVPKVTSILSERLSAGPGDKAGLSIATPPQLFSPSSRSQPSVIQRLARPTQQRPPFSATGPSQVPPQRYFSPNAPLPPHSLPSSVSHSRPTYHAPNVTVSAGHRPNPLVPPSHGSGHLPHPMYMRGQHGLYSGYPNIQPPPIHSGSPQNFTGPYQNPFSNYYAAAAAAVERRSGAIMSHTLEPFDNKSSPSTHERMAAYAHSSLTALTSLSTRNPANPVGEADDERYGPPGNAPGSTEFSGLVSYFSSQQDDLDN